MMYESIVNEMFAKYMWSDRERLMNENIRRVGVQVYLSWRLEMYALRWFVHVEQMNDERKEYEFGVEG